MKTIYSIFGLCLVMLFFATPQSSAQSLSAECEGTIRSKAQYPRFELMNEFGVRQGWLESSFDNVNLSAFGGKLQLLTRSTVTPEVRMVIDPDGQVGVGTETPEERFHIKGGNFLVDSGRVYLHDASIFMLDGGTEEIRFHNEGGDLAINTVGPASDYQLYIKDDNGFVALNHNNPTSQLHVKQADNWSGIRLENDASTNNWNVYCDNVSDYNFAFNDTLKAYISDSDGSYNIASDRRVKNSIQSLPPVLDKVNQLRPATYYYNSDKSRQQKSLGFIAQEVEAVFPELINEKGDLKTLTYDDFAILAIKAIQEQQQIIQKQASLIDALDQRLHTLENK